MIVKPGLKKTYTEENETVIGNRIYIYSTLCFKELPEVYNTAMKPWVGIDGAINWRNLKAD